MIESLQEKAFIEVEADAWFERNIDGILSSVKPDHHIIKAIQKLELPQSGRFADLGGGSGMVSAGILNLLPKWEGHVLEPSRKAIDHGHASFPSLRFHQGSITQATDLPKGPFDLVVVSGVLTWVDRTLLSQAIANTDIIVKNGGYLIISDFDPAHPRANPYRHREGLFTYKQDYAQPFLSLNLYTLIHRESRSLAGHSKCDATDPFDTRWMTAVLQKDYSGRYFKNHC